MVRVALNEAAGTDRGDAIVAGMIAYLRQQRILLPAATVLERLALLARARARKQAYAALASKSRRRTAEESRRAPDGG